MKQVLLITILLLSAAAYADEGDTSYTEAYFSSTSSTGPIDSNTSYTITNNPAVENSRVQTMVDSLLGGGGVGAPAMGESTFSSWSPGSTSSYGGTSR
jgi:hypothetical protein